MKKIKIVTSAVIRLLIIIAPGVVASGYLWGREKPLVAALAALGVEAIWLIILVIPVVLIEMRKSEKKAEPEQ